MTSHSPSEPVVMRGALATWQPISWSQEDWVAAFKVEKIKVRLGEKEERLPHPQWERFTRVSSVSLCCVTLTLCDATLCDVQVVETTPAQFFSPDSRRELLGDKRWGYLDYQYMQEILLPEKLGNNNVSASAV